MTYKLFIFRSLDDFHEPIFGTEVPTLFSSPVTERLALGLDKVLASPDPNLTQTRTPDMKFILLSIRRHTELTVGALLFGNHVQNLVGCELLFHDREIIA